MPNMLWIYFKAPRQVLRNNKDIFYLFLLPLPFYLFHFSDFSISLG